MEQSLKRKRESVEREFYKSVHATSLEPKRPLQSFTYELPTKIPQPASPGKSPLRPLLLPQLVEQRRRRESVDHTVGVGSRTKSQSPLRKSYVPEPQGGHHKRTISDLSPSWRAHDLRKEQRRVEFNLRDLREDAPMPDLPSEPLEEVAAAHDYVPRQAQQETDAVDVKLRDSGFHRSHAHLDPLTSGNTTPYLHGPNLTTHASSNSPQALGTVYHDPRVSRVHAQMQSLQGHNNQLIHRVPETTSLDPSSSVAARVQAAQTESPQEGVSAIDAGSLFNDNFEDDLHAQLQHTTRRALSANEPEILLDDDVEDEDMEETAIYQSQNTVTMRMW
jgi:hypothetical protein